jgi:hypothetical protein
MPFLISAPWLALLPALAFAAVARRRGGRAGWVAAGAWAFYAIYEEGMYLRLLCSGECNIRIDLLLLHPLLLVGTVWAIVVLWRRAPQP